MHTIIIALLTCCFSFPTLAWSQTGNTGAGEGPPGAGPGDDLLPPIDSPYTGPLGRVDDREPHEACDTCFTVPGMGEGYTIWESVRVGEDSEFLILRYLANPAPLEDGAERPMFDEAGEPLWYVGTQAHSGPQDTALLGDTGFTLIEVKRVRHRHEPALMAIPGVRGVGISINGISVAVAPGTDTADIPPDIEGIPTDIRIEAEEATLQWHASSEFRPIPTGARITAAEPVTGAYAGAGTLGPHIVHNDGGCCTIWSLTAAHVVRRRPYDPPPLLGGGNIPIYQPYVDISDLAGRVVHLFQIRPCASSACASPTNYTTEDPDVAAIDLSPVGQVQRYPYNNPTGTDPVRRLQSDHDSYKNGPSGAIYTPMPGRTAQIWGAFSGMQEGDIDEVDRTKFPSLDGIRYRICCLTSMEAEPVPGDSGAAVTYKGTGNRHVLGLHIAGDPYRAWFIPAGDIKEAFKADGETFTHFWGTKDGYRKPSQRTCDPPGC